MEEVILITAPQAALIPVVMAVVEIIKMTVVKNAQWAPLMALVFGVLGVVFVIPSVTLPLSVLSGIIVGATAAGVYGGVKKTVTG